MRELQKDVEKELLVSGIDTGHSDSTLKIFQLLPEPKREAMRPKFGIFVGRWYFAEPEFWFHKPR